VGGVAAVVLGIAYLATMPLFASVGVPPRGGEAWLAYSAGKTGAWWGILALSVLTDLLFVPVAFALYFALRRVTRGLALLGSAYVGLFAVLDLAVTWSNYAALITLSESYVGATSDAQRLVYVAAAEYASTGVTFSQSVYSILVPALGVLLVGLAMVRSPFGRGIAYLGVVTGVLGIVSLVGPLVVSALSATMIVTSLLTTVWVVLVGYRLFRLGAAASPR